MSTIIFRNYKKYLQQPVQRQQHRQPQQQQQQPQEEEEEQQQQQHQQQIKGLRHCRRPPNGTIVQLTI